ncbi:TMhelix containing protein [Vibrio phage 1.170.O._10N.261.52.C3]|nr:TMhelix containing protein [Vibrio phage 1.170.O._10N.261.52.C3]
MPYQSTISSTIQLGTVSVGAANFGSTVFVTANSYFTERLRPYMSMEEVRNDPAIPSDSNAYAGLLSAFKQPGCAVPVWLGRRKADNATLTPVVADNKVYTFKIEVVADVDGSVPESGTISFTSGTSATADDIVTGLKASLTSESITLVTPTGTSELILTPTAGYSMNITAIANMTEVSATTETAADLLAAIQAENNEDWYFLTCEDHTETFILAMSSAIDATESSNYTKQYRVAIADANVLTPLADPAVDILGKLKDGNFARVQGEWHDQADVIFPEVAATCYNGQFFPGTTTWKFMNNQTGVPAARNLVTGAKLSTQLQGYISDRNASWVGAERGVDFMHGGKLAGGEWIDVVRGKDWINDTIEVRLTNLFLNAVGSKISFSESGKAKVKGVIESVLNEAVQRDILLGYTPVEIPDNVSFEDQANRILKDVKWVGYLSGAIHFVIVNGVLTYQTAELD